MFRPPHRESRQDSEFTTELQTTDNY